MSFEGFPDEGLVFYEGLDADNSKTYWQRNKSAYEEHVRAPLLALLSERANRWRNTVGDILSMAFCIFIAWHAWKFFHEAWADALLAELRPNAVGVYSNFIGAEDPSRVREAYPDLTYQRLAQVKRVIGHIRAYLGHLLR